MYCLFSHKIVDFWGGFGRLVDKIILIKHLEDILPLK